MTRIRALTAAFAVLITSSSLANDYENIGLQFEVYKDNQLIEQFYSSQVIKNGSFLTPYPVIRRGHQTGYPTLTCNGKKRVYDVVLVESGTTYRFENNSKGKLQIIFEHVSPPSMDKLSEPLSDMSKCKNIEVPTLKRTSVKHLIDLKEGSHTLEHGNGLTTKLSIHR